MRTIWSSTFRTTALTLLAAVLAMAFGVTLPVPNGKGQKVQ